MSKEITKVKLPEDRKITTIFDVYAAQIAQIEEQRRPCFLHKATVQVCSTQSGKQVFYAGTDQGISAGYCATPEEAMKAFDTYWMTGTYIAKTLEQLG